MPKQLETSEHAKKDFLKTRYYKTNILLIMEYVKKYFEENKIKIVSYDTTYNEISVEDELYNMTVRFVQVEPAEAAVDLFVDSYFLFDFNKTKKLINAFYDMLGKKFELKGLALHKENYDGRDIKQF